MATRRITADRLTFGIEIEGLLPIDVLQREGITVGGYHSGDQVPGMPDGWNAQSDISIHERPAYTGVEIVSPILQGVDGLEQTVQVCQALRRWGWRINGSCGLHIHIGTRMLGGDALNRSPEFLRKVTSLVMRNETALFASTGTKVRENVHAGTSYSRSAREEFAARLNSLDASRHNVGRRGQTLNLSNLAGYGGKKTIEFRVFQSSVKVAKVATYVQACLGLVCKAYSMKRRAKFNVENADLQGTGGRMHQLTHDLCWLDYRGMAEQRHGRLLTDDQILEHRGEGFSCLGFLPTVPESVAELKRLAKKYDSDDRAESGHRNRCHVNRTRVPA